MINRYYLLAFSQVPKRFPNGIIAEKYHPELVSQKKNMEAANWNLKASRGAFRPQVDLNGSYGRSGGAFSGQNLELREDWELGLRLNMNFSGNSLGLSGVKQKTSPKLGQSSRTELETLSATVGILDNLKSRTDYKDARFSRDQAQAQLKKARLDIMNEVRNSYAGLRKARLQVQISQTDLELAQTAFKVAKIKSALRDVPLSERSIARNKLAQAEAGVMESQTAYDVAQAALMRAIGSADGIWK